MSGAHPSNELWTFPPTASSLELMTSNRQLECTVSSATGTETSLFHYSVSGWFSSPKLWPLQSLSKFLTVLRTNTSHTPISWNLFLFLQPRRCLGRWAIGHVSLSLDSSSVEGEPSNSHTPVRCIAAVLGCHHERTVDFGHSLLKTPSTCPQSKYLGS